MNQPEFSKLSQTWTQSRISCLKCQEKLCGAIALSLALALFRASISALETLVSKLDQLFWFGRYLVQGISCFIIVILGKR